MTAPLSTAGLRLALSMGLFDWIKRRAEAPPAHADAFLRGDRAELERVYRKTFAQVRRAASSVLREPADRDAVVQEVYLALIADPSLRASYGGGNLGAWLAAIARHRALDFARRQKRLAPLDALAEEESPEPLLSPELRLELSRFAERLDPSRRRLLELRFIEGLTQVEAAQVLQIPRSTLESREHELKAQLRVHLLGDRDEGSVP